MAEHDLKAYQAAAARMGERVEESLRSMPDPVMNQFVATLDRALKERVPLKDVLDGIAKHVTESREDVARVFEALMMACTALTVATSFIERWKARNERQDDGSADQADHPTRL